MPLLSHSGPGIATLAENLATKQQLIADAWALTGEADGADSIGVNDVLIAWAGTGSAGAEHDGRLWWQLKEACASFYNRRSAVSFAFRPEATALANPRIASSHASAQRVTQHHDATVRAQRLTGKSRPATNAFACARASVQQLGSRMRLTTASAEAAARRPSGEATP